MHKRVMLAAVLMAGGAMAEEQAPAETPRRNVVAIDVGGLLQESVSVSAERAVHERISLRLGLRTGVSALWAHVPFETASDSSGSWNMSHRSVILAFEPGARLFLTGRALEGLWIGPQLGVGVRWSHEGSSSDLNPDYRTGAAGTSLDLSASALGGYSVVLGRRLTLQAAVGARLGYARALSGWNESVGIDPQGHTVHLRTEVQGHFTQWALQPVTQLALGYAF
ncbi:hypothetical protein FGE12_22560 [Aggregicoccus sp. 17bor-14]|uniref:hypothetical protein n=1 Tax=Myxococcaceae TaxID=31 RepID=UPI00129CEEDA|nr:MULTISPECIES: hypothetical protein [Myxococcaceae]MBF5045204.1 hypothetical protein [Simulacricoccus sp. 17bor-14]MRI90945.1 hypothetical protein [Aggregicoccus sp. 17bor-14]